MLSGNYGLHSQPVALLAGPPFVCESSVEPETAVYIGVQGTPVTSNLVNMTGSTIRVDLKGLAFAEL
jgi:hypothetical protein